MNNKYLIRLDDACPTMNKAKWQRIFDILDQYGVHPMVGIIPHNEDPDQEIDAPDLEFWNKAKQWQDKGYAIAMHGYNHVCISEGGMNGLNPIWHRSEFAGVSLDVQKQKIRDGFEILVGHGLNPQWFFAPSHTFDENTLIALKECSNIRKISDTIAINPYSSRGLIFVPCQMGRLREMPLKGFWCACYHPSIMDEAEFVALEKFLVRHQEEFASFAELPVNRKGIMDRALASLYFIYRRVKR